MVSRGDCAAMNNYVQSSPDTCINGCKKTGVVDVVTNIESISQAAILADDKEYPFSVLLG